MQNKKSVQLERLYVNRRCYMAYEGALSRMLTPDVTELEVLWSRALALVIVAGRRSHEAGTWVRLTTHAMPCEDRSAATRHGVEMVTVIEQQYEAAHRGDREQWQSLQRQIDAFVDETSWQRARDVAEASLLPAKSASTDGFIRPPESSGDGLPN